MTEDELMGHAARAAADTVRHPILPHPTPEQIKSIRMYLGAEPTRERNAA